MEIVNNFENKTGYYYCVYEDIEKIIKETQKDGSIPPKIRYIDLRLGSKCQLACVMCSPHDSSGWIKEWQQIHPQIQNEKLKNTSQWYNKGKVDGASYNWHKNSDIDLHILINYSDFTFWCRCSRF